MARDPGSVWAPLPEAGAPDGYAKSQLIVHSTGDNGTAAATARYFGGPTPNESTFIVGQGPLDPTLQIMDSSDRADANMSASIRAISVEVVGDGIGGYNAWQRSELIRLGRWARSTHPIAARIIPSEPESGFGWHVMFGAPGPWAGVAKTCPGPARIRELQADIFPAIFAATSEEDDMYGPDQRYELVTLGQEVLGNARATNSEVARNAIRLERILAAVEAKPLDVNALGDRIAASIVGPVVAALAGKGGLTEDDVKVAIRDVLGGLDDATRVAEPS